MSVYAALTHALTSPYSSEAVRSLLAQLPPRKSLSKPGAYQASLTFKREGIYLIFEWQPPEWSLTSAILFPGGIEGFSRFRELIEGTVALPSDRPDVRAALGRPTEAGGGGQPLMRVLVDYE